MLLSGACFCRAIEWEADIGDSLIGLCHCRDCQIFSGSGFRVACAGDPAKFNFTKGTPKYFHKTADSGKVRRMAFCGECGTHLSSMPREGEEEGNYVSIRLATSDKFPELKPTAEIFCDSRVSWLTPVEGTAQFPTMP